MEGTTMSFETRATPAGELRYAIDGGKARIDGRAILFDSWSVDLGGFKERMMPNSVQLEGDLLALFDHATDKVLGRTSAGTMEVRQDQAGVAFTAYPPATTWANDLRVSIERGDIKGCSFRMMVEEDKWYVDMNGQVCRDIIKANVSELTVTSMPAYPETTAEARSQAAAIKKQLDQIKPEDRAGRVLSTDNQGRLVLARDVLDMATEMIEKATESIDAVIATVDPTYKPDSEDGMDGCDCGQPDCATCNPTSSESTDGASDSSRSSDGASETPTRRSQTYVYGFGFIPTRKVK